LLVFAALALCQGGAARGQPREARGDVPPELAPLEFLVGRWKGQGVPKDDPARRFRGWTETHAWAWVFSKGRVTGLRLDVQGGRLIGAATLTYDPKRREYRLEGRPPGADAGAFLYTGTLDQGGKRLVLESLGKAGDARLTLRPNANFVRYTLRSESRDAGAASYAPRVEVGLTKEGESLASGSSSAERPRCVVTGGAATLSVGFRGRSYPICCTGCRDEFNADPEKYLRKLASRDRAGDEGKARPGTPSKVSRHEDAFADDLPAGEPPGPERKPPPPRRKDGG
jgi:YHS domain-containing protein